MLAVGLLFAPGAAQATTTAGKPVAWGCGGVGAWGQCSVPNGLSGVTAIAAGNYYSLAVKSDGTVVAWGCGLLGVQGACNVPSDLSGVTRIAAGGDYALALKADGTLVAWGKNCSDVYTDFGQCNVPSSLSGVTAIAAGFAQSLAVKSDGTVVAWGCGTASGFSSDYGQCDVPAGLSGVTAVAAGYFHSLALKSDGTVVAWGCAIDNVGQCSVPNGLSGVTAIAAGAFHSLALKSDGTVVAWGCGGGTDNGQCSVPNGLSGVTAISAGLHHSMALVELTNQTITFGPLANKTYGDPDFSMSATASSGLAVSFAASGNCTVSGVTVHLTGAGSCTVTASQPGDANYNPATAVSRTFAIAKADQSLSFDSLANKTYGDPDFSISGAASSALAISFAPSGNCTVSGAVVHLTGAGSCTITASQGGNANYNSAPDVSQTFAIVTASQTISFGPLANKTYGAPDFGVSATASSGLPVSFSANGNCTMSAAAVHLTGAGSCTVTASQAGDANYKAAPDVSRSFSVAPAPCRVPNVVGRGVATAKLAIARRHCRTGKVGYAHSSKRKRGIVLSQSRRPGRVLPARSKIDLVVSRGRRR